MGKSPSKLRCAVIGLGIGRGHAQAYMESPEAELVAICDIDPERLKLFKDKLPQDKWYDDYKRMLKETRPDLVSVAVPNDLHAPMTIDALRAGAHVLCEKPMAMNVALCRQMIKEAQKAKRKLGIDLSYRFTPQARALKDLADAGFLGQPYHAHTQWTRRDGFPGFGGWFGQKARSGGGPLIDLGVHRIDLAMWLMGLPQPVAVSGATHHDVGIPRAKARHEAFDCEDFATGFVRFDNGASMVVQTSWAGHQAAQEKMITQVTGTHGTLVHRNNEEGKYTFVAEAFHQQNGHHFATTLALPRGDIRSAFGEMINSVVNDKPLIASGEDGLRVQQILDALYESAATGREVRIAD